MKNYNRHVHAAATLLLMVSLASCAPIPIYQPPTDTTQSAQLKLSLKDESRLLGVAIISRIEGDIICGEPLPNLQKMIVISKGNPLISNLNPSGVYIPAGRRFTLSAMGLNDGFRECGRIVSFVPKAGSRYEITLTNITTRTSDAPPTACPIGLVEVTPGTSTKEPVETTYEQCRPRN